MRVAAAFATLAAAAFTVTMAAPVAVPVTTSVYARDDVSAVPFQHAVELLNKRTREVPAHLPPRPKRIAEVPNETTQQAQARRKAAADYTDWYRKHMAPYLKAQKEGAAQAGASAPEPAAGQSATKPYSPPDTLKLPPLNLNAGGHQPAADKIPAMEPHVPQ
ncbi:hypothetical protein EIP91_004951 [Steccherinum ochraceum]|uniref:Uncharacterized protein n=1 Tax=Steccherinum ochraceum TaxID=92696 RepID=A0A4R0RJ02_9APHY|nr:hypothetical protein EIP91_004951 [Steccherinum ochraceum]